MTRIGDSFRGLLSFGRAGGPKAPDESSPAAWNAFTRAAAALGPEASVLEIGTRETVPGRILTSMLHFPHVQRSRYVLADVQPGLGVDVVADVHRLPPDWAGRFDAVVAVAVFEHLERPWIAAAEIARALAPGGFCYISTCQTFPLHAHPSDFFRFSREALALIFRDAGLDIVECAYQHRTKIIAPKGFMTPATQKTWNDIWPSYLTVDVFATKRG